MSRLRAVLARGCAIALASIGAVVFAPAAHAATCTTYYVSSASGSDSNDGCSASTPWQSVAKINATTFSAGNQVLFQDGGSWSGELAPQGSGASGNPIVLSSYGSGAAPIINGAGAAAAVYLVNQQYWTIQNLEITNTASSATVRSGIQLENDTSGVLNGIHILNNNIHDVLGYWSGPQPSTSAGIAFNLSDSYSTNGWNDVLIQGNALNHVDAAGMYIGSLAGQGHAINTSNVVIQNNTMNDAGGNDIVCVYCVSPLVQYNVVTNSGYRYSGAGLWMAQNNGGTWQYNEVSRQWRSLWDGEAFDIDWANNGVTLQYNYSHDNAFGFMEFCCRNDAGATNSTIRYNISQNDGSMNAVFSTFSGATSTGTTQFYNNTVYQGAENNAPITNSAPNASNLVFSNNIIYKLGDGGYAGGSTWTHNLFYGDHPASEPADPSKITSDPLLVAPGGGGNGRSTAAAYQLAAGSPAIGTGTLITNNGGQDFFGNTVSATAAPDYGAYNGPGVTAPAASYGAAYTFDAGTGTRANDASNHQNTGTLQGSASWTAGKNGAHALNLTGASNSYVDIPTTTVNTGSSYSVAAWVKLNSLTGWQTFASVNGASVSPFYLQLESGQWAFVVRDSDSTASNATLVHGGTAATGAWYHLIGVYDATAHTASIYVNGVLAGTAPFSGGWKATGHSSVGSGLWNGVRGDWVNGAIDDVRFIPKAVTKYEAYALGTNATADYELDEGTGATTGNLITGTPYGLLSGTAAWTTGKVGPSAVALNGTPRSDVDVNENPVDTGSSYSSSVWVKFNSVSGTQTALSIDGLHLPGMAVQLLSGKICYITRASDTNSAVGTVVTGPAPTPGTWYQITTTYDSGTGVMSLYINGTLYGTASYTTPWTATGGVQIGRGLWNASQEAYTNATVDDVHFWNRPLTAAEVSTLYSL